MRYILEKERKYRVYNKFIITSVTILNVKNVNLKSQDYYDQQNDNFD